MEATWPRMASVVDEAGARLQAEYGAEGIPAEAFRREIERLGGYGRDSVPPSDYCYNVVNRAPPSLRHPSLLRVGRGLYRHVGPGYAYTGPIWWKPKGEEERQVGRWHEGRCLLGKDPRVQAFQERGAGGKPSG